MDFAGRNNTLDPSVEQYIKKLELRNAELIRHLES
jgi:hypothetical protein